MGWAGLDLRGSVASIILGWAVTGFSGSPVPKMAAVDTPTSDPVSPPSKSPCIMMHLFCIDSVPLENPDSYSIGRQLLDVLGRTYLLPGAFPVGTGSQDLE